MEEVKIIINKKTGRMSFDCNGFIGEGCSVIEEIEAQLGTVQQHANKDERYQYEIPVPATQGLVG
jgi:hypothetical protein